jgi:hypothetical protein
MELTDVEGAILAIDKAVGVSQIYAGVRDAIDESSGKQPPSKPELVAALRGHASSQTVLLPTGKPEKRDLRKEASRMVVSPILTCLENLLRKGVVSFLLRYAVRASFFQFTDGALSLATCTVCAICAAIDRQDYRGPGFHEPQSTDASRTEKTQRTDIQGLATGITYFDHISNVFESGTTP